MAIWVLLMPPRPPDRRRLAGARMDSGGALFEELAPKRISSPKVSILPKWDLETAPFDLRLWK